MAHTKFKVGDRVRLKKSSEYFCQSKGDSGKVLETRGFCGDPDWHRVEWDHGYKDNYPVDDLVLVGSAKDTPRFKVGDRIRIIKSDYPENVGLKGTVTDIETDYLWANWDDGDFARTLIERVEPVEKAENLVFRPQHNPMYFSGIRAPLWRFSWDDPETPKRQSIMRRISNLAKKMLDKDTRSLVEADVLAEDLTVSDSSFILEYLVGVHKKELAAEARKRLEDEKEDE